MLTITAAQLQMLTMDMFFSRIQRFIAENCKSEKLLNFAADGKALHDIWTPAWERARLLSEHDCAMFLVMLAVCHYEEIALTDIDAMAGTIGEQEVPMKNFFERRGYFAFSAFDYPAQVVQRGAHG